LEGNPNPSPNPNPILNPILNPNPNLEGALGAAANARDQAQQALALAIGSHDLAIGSHAAGLNVFEEEKRVELEAKDDELKEVPSTMRMP